MRLKKPGVLPDDVHNIRGDNGLVVFASFLLDQT